MIAVFQWIAFLVLSFVSFFFTFNLSYALAADTIGKIAMIVGSVGLEFTKMFAIMSASTYSYVGKQLGVKIKKTAFMYFAYVFIAVYAISASFGYAQQTVDKMRTENAIVSYTDDINLLKENISTYDTQIADLRASIATRQASIATIPPERIDRITEINNLIKKDNASIDIKIAAKTAAQQQISDLRAKGLDQSKTVSRSMYDVVGETLNVPARSVAFVILFWFALAIEFGIFTTAPHMRKIGGFVVEKENENFDYEVSKKNKKTTKKQIAKKNEVAIPKEKKSITSFFKKEEKKQEDIKPVLMQPEELKKQLKEMQEETKEAQPVREFFGEGPMPETLKKQIEEMQKKPEEKVEEPLPVVEKEPEKVAEKAKVVDNNIPERKTLEEPVVVKIGQHPDKVIKTSGPDIQVINKDKEHKITTHEEILTADSDFSPAKSQKTRDLVSKF